MPTACELPDAALARSLTAWMGEHGPCVVAFSGGVDSAVVAAAAARADRTFPAGRRSLAVTAISPAVPETQIEIARRVAAEIGIEHLTVATEEIERGEYTRNDSRRCFYCKQTLYSALRRIAERQLELQGNSGLQIVSGTNADDLGDYRPGIEAGQLAGIATPLADLGYGKLEVRRLARHWGLSVAELPAAPCLASRIAYGVEVTAERLKMVEAAERWLGDRGFSPLRVRLLPGELAKIEVAAEQLSRLVEEPLRRAAVARLGEIGFRGVTVDIEGFRSGAMNRLYNITSLTSP